MGSILYDFLADSFLLNSEAIAKEYSDYSDKALAKELKRYREFCLKRLPELNMEATPDRNHISVVATEGTTRMDVLMRGALYLDRFVVNDPLFLKTRQVTQVEQVYGQFISGKKKAKPLPRGDIATAANYLKSIAPFVAHDYVRVLPFSVRAEPPAQLPIFYSETRFKELLPESLLSFLRSRAHVYPTRRMGERWAVFDEPLAPCRGIIIQFEGAEPGAVYGYHLWQTQFQKIPGHKDTLRTVMTMPDTPPDKAQFDAWVEQSTNSAAHSLVQRTTNAITVASSLGSMFLAPSALAAELADFTLDESNGIQAFSATQALRLDLPWLTGADPTRVMEIRSNDGEAFANFREAFDAKFRELRTVENPDELRIKIENAIHELTETQVHALDAKMQSLRKKAVAEAGLAVLGLAGAVQTSGWTLLASVVAATQGCRTWADYRATVRDNPAYFALKLKKDLAK